MGDSSSYQSKRKLTEQEHEEVKTKVSDLKAEMTERAHHIIWDVMPAKVLELTELYMKNPKFNLPLDKVHTDIPNIKLSHTSKSSCCCSCTSNNNNNSNNTNTQTSDADAQTKKRKLDDASEASKPTIPVNPVIADMLVSLKKEVIDLIEMINTVKIWIQLNVPRIEDGNNFGVSIQEETINELTRAEDGSLSILESIAKYYTARGKLITEALKYPEIDDYKRVVLELDEKEYVNLRLCALDLRNNYAILHDMIVKNLEKLKTPRSSHHMAAIF